MKMYTLIATLDTALISSTALASGNHAGGNHADSNAIGQPGRADKMSRTITVDLTDAMRFTPADITVKRDETIRFVVKNFGNVKHEMVLGTKKELKDHYDMMKKFPEMEHADKTWSLCSQGRLVKSFGNSPRLEKSILTAFSRATMTQG